MTLPTPKEFCNQYCKAGLILTTKSIVEKRDAQIAELLIEEFGYLSPRISPYYSKIWRIIEKLRGAP